MKASHCTSASPLSKYVHCLHVTRKVLMNMQIMDPKMDSGFLEAGETLCNDYDVLEPPSVQEMVGIIDQMLCHEVRLGRNLLPIYSRICSTRLHIKFVRLLKPVNKWTNGKLQ